MSPHVDLAVLIESCTNRELGTQDLQAVTLFIFRYIECGLNCPCGDRCSNKMMQKRLYSRDLRRVKTPNKGYGIVAKTKLAKVFGVDGTVVHYICTKI